MPLQRLPSRSELLLAVLVVLLSICVGATSAGVGKVVEQEGDVASFTVTHDNASQAQVQFGTDEVNYKVNMTVRGGSDEELTIFVNTYEAGGWRGDTPDDVFSARGGAIVSISRETPTLSAPLATADYGIYVRTEGMLTDRGTLSLTERQTRDLTILTAPEGESGQSLESILQTATETATITEGDYLVTKIEASGLSGYVEDASDLERGTEGVSLSLSEKRPNAGPTTVELDETRFSNANDETYLVFDTKDLDVKAGSKYTMTFEIDAAKNPYSTQTETLTREITLRERTLRFADSEPIVFAPEKGQQVELSTSVAPGTRFTVTALSDAPNNSFRKRDTVEVSADGSLTPTFDFTGVDGGTEFRIVVVGEDLRATGYVGSTPGETTTDESAPTSSPAETTGSPTDSEPTAEDAPTTESSPTDDSGPTTNADTTRESTNASTSTQSDDSGSNAPDSFGGVPTAKLALAGAAILFLGVFMKIVF